MYLFFEPILDIQKRYLERSLLSLFELPAQIIPAFFFDNSFCSRKSIRNFSALELLKFCWFQQFHIPALALNFPQELESDDKLIEHFSNGYLGSVSGTIRKKEFQKLALLYHQLSQVEHSRRLFSVPAYVVEERLHQLPFSEAEIEELTKIQESSLNLVDQFIQKKTLELKHNLGALPPIVRRGFR
jgi:hypothetical protein